MSSTDAPAAEAGRRPAGGGGGADGSGAHHAFDIVSQRVLHRRYLCVLDRTVRFTAPDGAQHDVVFDVVSHPTAGNRFVTVFPFHPYADGRKGGEVTIIREYGQGPHAYICGLPSGAFDPQRHADFLAAAQAELSEEAFLTGGAWTPLLPPGHPGMVEVKWCANRCHPFLVVDPQPDPCPQTRDAEEQTLQVLRMPVAEFEELMMGGQVTSASQASSYMALQRLRRDGLL